MTTHEIHLELLLGKPVVDAIGKRIGRIEEIRAVQQDGEWVIQEYLVGSAAVLERLSAWQLGLGLLRLLGSRKFYGGYRVPWDKLDLSDLDRPCLRGSLDELETLSNPLEQPRQKD